MKVLLVDDEAIVRIGIKSMIDWASYGFELIGEVGNGREALDLIISEKPEIVITDIKMPIMDGIELIREAKHVAPHIKFIVLSSYDEFYYVKEALMLGAVDYLLKVEVDSQSLMTVIQQLKHQIEHTSQEDYTSDAQQIKKNIGALRNELFRKVISGVLISEDSFKKEQELLDMTFHHHQLFFLGIMTKPLHGVVIEPHKIYTHQFAIRNIASEIMNEEFMGYAFDVKGSHLFLCFTHKMGYDTSMDAIHFMGSRIIEMLYQYLNVQCAIGIGEGDNTLKGFKKGYMEANEALDYRIICGYGKVFIRKQKERLVLSDQLPHMNTCMASFAKVLGSYDFIALNKYHHELQLLIKQKKYTVNAWIKLASSMLYAYEEFVQDRKCLEIEECDEDRINHHHLNTIETYIEFEEWLAGLMAEISKRFDAMNSDDISRIIVKAEAFIKTHYNQNISLSDVANSVHLNPTYLSTIFHKTKKMKYSDYVTKVRIDKAIELLIQTDKKIYAISDEIGYKNVHYFNRVFRKQMGTTPKAFRSRNAPIM